MSEQYISKRPFPTDFNQQTLPDLKPRMKLFDLIFAYYVFGALFFAFGGFVFTQSDEVIGYSIEYDGANTAHSDCSISYANEGSDCRVTFTFTEDISGPIYLFYELTGYYQNHLRYLSSMSSSQLLGENLAYDDVYSDCYPVVGNGSTVLNPCGLVANTFFNDIITISSSTFNATLDSSSLTWSDDGTTRFVQVDGFVYDEVTDTSDSCEDVLGSGYSDCSSYTEDGVTYYYWYPNDDTVQYLYETYSDIVSPIEGVTNQHFMVWMRAAGLPEFKKLYGVIDSDVSSGDTITFKIVNNFEVLTYGGTKSLVLSNLKSTGAQNYALAYSYFLAGSLCICFGLLMGWKRTASPRPLGDIRVLDLQ